MKDWDVSPKLVSTTAQNSPKHHCHRPDRLVWLDQKLSRISNFDRGFPVSCQNVMQLIILTGWPFQKTCAVSVDDLQSSRVNSRLQPPFFTSKGILTRRVISAQTRFSTPVSRCLLMGYSWSFFVAQSVLLKCCLNAGLTPELLCTDTPPPLRTDDCFALATAFHMSDIDKVLVDDARKT